MTISCCLVSIDGEIQRRVFFVRNLAVKYAKEHSQGKPWRVILMEELWDLARGVGDQDLSV